MFYDMIKSVESRMRDHLSSYQMSLLHDILVETLSNPTSDESFREFGTSQVN